MVISPLFVYQGTMPLKKRDDQAHPHHTPACSVEGDRTARTGGSIGARYIPQCRRYPNFTPVLPHLRCGRIDPVPHPRDLPEKEGTQRSARWWAAWGCHRILLIRPTAVDRTSRVVDQQKKESLFFGKNIEKVWPGRHWIGGQKGGNFESPP